jgi:hypothetical protein
MCLLCQNEWNKLSRSIVFCTRTSQNLFEKMTLLFNRWISPRLPLWIQLTPVLSISLEFKWNPHLRMNLLARFFLCGEQFSLPKKWSDKWNDKHCLCKQKKLQGFLPTNENINKSERNRWIGLTKCLIE